MYSAIVGALRTALGVAISLGFGYLSILASVLILDLLVYSAPELNISVWWVRSAWFSGMGFAAGVGAFIAWIDEDNPRRIDKARLILALTTGVIGSWAGLLYSINVNRESVFTDHPVSGAALFLASFAANGAVTTLAVFRHARQKSAPQA